MELADRYGIKRDSVRRHVRQAGVLRSREALSPEKVEVAMTLRERGLFYRQIAEKMRVDTETVQRAVLRQLDEGPGRQPPALG